MGGGGAGQLVAFCCKWPRKKRSGRNSPEVSATEQAGAASEGAPKGWESSPRTLGSLDGEAHGKRKTNGDLETAELRLVHFQPQHNLFPSHWLTAKRRGHRVNLCEAWLKK